MGAHLIDGKFQSDKYPTTPRGKVPLSVEDEAAQALLWEYAQRRRAVDAEFADDVERALELAGYSPRHVDRDVSGRTQVSIGLLLPMLTRMHAAERAALFEYLGDKYCIHCGNDGGWQCMCTNDD